MTGAATIHVDHSGRLRRLSQQRERLADVSTRAKPKPDPRPESTRTVKGEENMTWT